MSHFPSQEQPLGAEAVVAVREDGRTPDPGSPRGAKISWICTIILMAVVIGFNQIPGKEPPKKTATQTAAVEPPDATNPFAMTAKFFVKVAQGWSLDASVRKDIVESLKKSAKTPEDRVRLAMVAADLEGTEAGLNQLSAAGELKEPLDGDAKILQRAYEAGGNVDDAADRQTLIDHHGWFGKLAGTYGLKNDDPARAPLLEGAGRLMALGVFAFVVLGVAFLGGIAACVTMAVMMGSGRVRARFVPPAPGGSVFIETVPVFIASFLLLHLVLALVAMVSSVNGEPPAWLMPLQLSAQWALIVIPLYPVLVRGMDWGEFRRGLGWHPGRGVLREVGAGVVGYFAGLPLLAVVIALTLGIIVARAAFYQMTHHGEDPPAPSNPIAELISKGSPAVLAMLFVLATCWAPVVEETIFRGAMYRQLRSRMGVLGAAVLSALTFGSMHGYNVLLLGPVICLGFVFALMREWRGSLIASMTAHFMHNATALTFVLLALSALKD